MNNLWLLTQLALMDKKDLLPAVISGTAICYPPHALPPGVTVQRFGWP